MTYRRKPTAAATAVRNCCRLGLRWQRYQHTWRNPNGLGFAQPWQTTQASKFTCRRSYTSAASCVVAWAPTGSWRTSRCLSHTKGWVTQKYIDTDAVRCGNIVPRLPQTCHCSCFFPSLLVTVQDRDAAMHKLGSALRRPALTELEDGRKVGDEAVCYFGAMIW